MADATIRGSLGSYNPGIATMIVAVPTDATAPVVGDWMMVIIIDTSVAGTTMTAPTPPSGSAWVALQSRIVFGSRYMTIWGKRRVAGETTYTFTASATSAMNAAIVYGPGGVLDPNSWQKGAFTKVSTTQTALALPSMTTTTKSLAVGLWGRAVTTTAETDAQNTVAGTGWVKQLFSMVASSGQAPNKEFIAYAPQSAAGAIASPTYTAGTGSGNFAGMMVAIPTLPDAAPAPTSNFTFTQTNLSVTVSDASSTTASGQSIVGGTWAWGDGATSVDVTPASHTYAAAGTYTISNTVRQTDGQTAVSSKQVTVTAAGPHVEFVTPAGFSTVTGVPFTVAGTGTPGMKVSLEYSSNAQAVAGITPSNPQIIDANGNWSFVVSTPPTVGGNQWHIAGTVDNNNYIIVDQYFTYQAPAITGLHASYHEPNLTTLTDTILKYFDGTTTYDLSRIIPILPGRKVSRFFEGMAVIAHRCGSVNYMEHTLRGATQSAAQGVTGLEISLGITSDGVFIGLHDQYLDRTTPGVPSANYNPQLHTWAEIQALQQTAPVGNNATWGAGPYPYYRLENFLDAYARSHTIFIDPKYIPTANRPALYALLNSYPNPKDTFVLKYYHTGTAIADEATAQGYKSWGYGYQADVDGTAGTTQMSTTQAKWTWLGMDYNANAAAWATVKSYNKPVIGHIAPTAAAATTLINYGAAGIMASGVDQVMPVLSGVTVPTLATTVTDHGKTYTWDLVQEFKTDAAAGSVRSTYSSMGYFNPGQGDTANNANNTGGATKGIYDPDQTLSVSGGYLTISQKTAVPSASAQANGAGTVAVPMGACVMPDNYQSRLHGVWEVRYKTTANKKGYKFVGIWWPTSDTWNEGEIDWPEADLTETPRPANAVPGTYSNGNMTFVPATAQYAATDTSDFHTARTVWNSDGMYFYWDGTLVASITNVSSIPTKPMRIELQAETFINQGQVPSDAVGSVIIDYVAAAS